MDEKRTNYHLNHPAYLWIGDTDTLIDQTIIFLQKQFCLQGGCSICIKCKQIQQQQHHAAVWLMPEKQYTLDDLETIFSTLAYALESDQHFFFIIQKADYLTASCANSLLKSLEEPPAGYHFILHAQRVDALLPTIRSRCVIHYFDAHNDTTPHSLFSYFSTPNSVDPLIYLQEIEKNCPHERESIELVDQLLSYWVSCYKKAILESDRTMKKRATVAIELLKKAIQKPPMPGSSKLFWKNLFMRWERSSF